MLSGKITYQLLLFIFLNEFNEEVKHEKIISIIRSKDDFGIKETP